MTIQLGALIGRHRRAARALHYWVANMIPSWNSSGVHEQIGLALVSVVDPLIWTVCFVAVWRKAPEPHRGMPVCALGLAEIGYTGYRQWESLSMLSLDTLTLTLGALIPVLCWALYLLAGSEMAVVVPGAVRRGASGVVGVPDG